MFMTNRSCLKLLYLLRQALDESYSQIVLTGALGNKTAAHAWAPKTSCCLYQLIAVSLGDIRSETLF